MDSTKERILQTSLKLFSQRGFSAVSVSSIAGEMNMSKGALYKHYKSKRDILDQIVLRMEKNDGEQAEAYGVPTENQVNTPVNLADILAYTKAQFRYWTEDEFASRFRRMLTLEQYGDAEMSHLYNQYLCSGPFEYVKELFGNYNNSKQLALEFYGPMYMLYSLYDTADDKEQVIAMLDKHVDKFTERIEENGI